MRLNTNELLRARALSLLIVCGAVVQSTPVHALTLDPPTATPPAGVYAPNINVVLTADTGATIRYTLDGSAPAVTSAVYSAPFALTADTTVRAIAVLDDGSTSAIMESIYRIDAIPPVIKAHLSPPANTAGWNNSPVTVSFECSDLRSGVVVCPGPIVFEEDGANQHVVVEAEDGVGNHATLDVLINIDTVPVLVSLGEPATNTRVTTSTVSVAAAIGESLSAVTYASCNGQQVTISEGAVSCTVSLKPGRNSVVVGIRDAAGNHSSAGVWVTRTGVASTLAVGPDTVSLTSGESRTVVAYDAYQVIDTDVTWSSADATVAMVASDGTVTAVSSGSAVITASVGDRSAHTIVTVQSGVPQTGTSQWTLAPANGLTPWQPIYANVVDPDGASLFALAADEDNQVVATAVRGDGTPLWNETVDGTPLFGDSFGGLVTVSAPACLHCTSGAGLTRTGGPDATVPWRYEPEANGLSTPIRSGIAQAEDGTIFVIEDGLDSEGYLNSTVVGLDGSTGRLKFRRPIPASTASQRSTSCTPWPYFFEPGTVAFGSTASALSVGSDGAAYFEVLESHDIWELACHIEGWPAGCGEGGCFPAGEAQHWDKGSGQWSRAQMLRLARVDANGAMTLTTLWESTFEGPDTDQNRFRTLETAALGAVVPDGTGGHLATWSHVTEDYAYDSHVTRVTTGGTEEHLVEWPTAAYWSPILMVGDNGTVFLESYNDNWERSVVALDATTWQPKWTIHGIWAWPIMPLADGGVVMEDLTPDGLALTLTAYDADGMSNTGFETSLNAVLSALRMGSWEGLSGDGALKSVSAMALRAAAFGFPNTQGQGAPTVYVHSHFMPVNLLQTSPNYDIDRYRTDLSAQVLNGARPYIVQGVRATVKAFLEELLSRRQTLAFIGHSVEREIPLGTYVSTGLLMYQPPQLLPDREYWIERPIDSLIPPPDYSRAHLIASGTTIPFNAQVLFFGECKVGDIFTALWGIPNEASTGPAIIVPKRKLSGEWLKAAAFAWKDILTQLRNGATVDDAVKYTNTLMKSGDTFNGETFFEPELDQNGQPIPVEFKVIGNATLKIKR